MIRGLLALYRGDNRKAIEHLGQAARLLPESVAAQSLLAHAYQLDGQWEHFRRIFTDSVEKLTPVTPEDYLFKGHAESYVDPSSALKTLDEAIRRRDSTIAHMFRADVRALVARDTSDVNMAQSAMDDASAAKNMMPGNPKVIWIDLLVHLDATWVFRDSGEKERAEASVLQVGRDARELEQFPAIPLSYVGRWFYLNLIGQEEAAHEVARKGYQEAENAVTRGLYVHALHEQGKLEEALQVGGRLMQPYILAELADGPSRALEAYRKNCEAYLTGYDAILNQAVLLLLGRREDAMDACKELRKHPERLADPRPGRHEHCLRILDYCAGSISAEQLLSPETGSRGNQCESHFYVALDRLAQADRAGAHEHFQKVLYTGKFDFAEYQLSRVFLKRMDQDPNWPSWIPLREPAAQPTPNPGQ